MKKLFFIAWLLFSFSLLQAQQVLPPPSPLPFMDRQVHARAQYVPTPESEYQIFYDLVKEKLSETKNPAEVLRYVNSLKAVSVREYKRYAAESVRLRRLRAAIRKAILKAFRESRFNYYPN